MRSRVSHIPFMVVLSSPSGAGKTSIIREVIRRDRGIVYSVSATTRPPRPEERNHRDYHFVSLSEFASLRRRGELLEWARVYGFWYGTPKAQLSAAFERGQDVIADLDVKGARTVKRLLPAAVTVFVTAPNGQELRRRLVARGTDDPEVLRRRIDESRHELAQAKRFDYLVVNGSLAEAVKDVMAIVRAERLRSWRHGAGHDRKEVHG
ncbi:MAG: guanylate kinase [candidate division WOR-3 bacterium]